MLKLHDDVGNVFLNTHNKTWEQTALSHESLLDKCSAVWLWSSSLTWAWSWSLLQAHNQAVWQSCLLLLPRMSSDILPGEVSIFQIFTVPSESFSTLIRLLAPRWLYIHIYIYISTGWLETLFLVSRMNHHFDNCSHEGMKNNIFHKCYFVSVNSWIISHLWIFSWTLSELIKKRHCDTVSLSSSYTGN